MVLSVFETEMAKPDAVIIKANEDLKRKIGTGKVSAEQIASCESFIQENKIDFVQFMHSCIEDLNRVLAQENIDKEALINPIMQLKANGQMFHYPFVSEYMGHLLDFLENQKQVSHKVIKLVKAYSDGLIALGKMNIIILKTGNPKAYELLQELTAAQEKLNHD